MANTPRFFGTGRGVTGVFFVTIDNENITQPIDVLMTKLGLTNAQLVKASTEQLSFKMVQKARKGRRLAPHIQEKILTAFLTVRPDLVLRRRDLFRYAMDQTIIDAIQNALARSRKREIKYPQFVELLTLAGVTGYTAEVASNRITFYGAHGEAYIEQGPMMSQAALGAYNEEGLRSAIHDAQKEIIDHPEFLKRIYEAGITTYEVNCRSRKIEYKSGTQSYKERLSLPVPRTEAVPPRIEEKRPEKKPKKKAARNKNRSMTRKARVDANKRYFKKRR